MAAPTITSYTEPASDWTSTTSPKTTASISWSTNDVVVVMIGNEGASTLGAPSTTGSNLTFTLQKNCAAASTCNTAIYAGVATGASSGTISCTSSNAGQHWGFAVWVWSGSAGIGNSSEQHTSTKTVAMTPTAADCGVVWGAFDFGAKAVGTQTPTPTHNRQAAVDTGRYTYNVADLTDQVSSGSTSYGITGSTGTGPWSLLVLEIKPSSSTNVTVTLTGNSATSTAGTLSMTGTAAVSITGRSMTATAGTLTATPGVTVSLTGNSITSTPGTLTATGGANVTVTGSSMTATRGTLTTTGGASVTVSGQSMTAAAGSLTATGGANVTLSGNTMTISAGSLSVAGSSNVTISGLAITSATGNLTVTTSSGSSFVPRLMVLGAG